MRKTLATLCTAGVLVLAPTVPALAQQTPQDRPYVVAVAAETPAPTPANPDARYDTQQETDYTGLWGLAGLLGLLGLTGLNGRNRSRNFTDTSATIAGRNRDRN
ncbi:WGxxGxxG family protein [Streptomyces lavendulae]|uniref:WGxxGxxG family protein n=1 Tax=Streptomyces lavendulae TaxID=1914 RepID=UPI00340FD84B